MSTTDLDTLVINYLTQAQYDAAVSGGTIEANEIYLTEAGTVPIEDVTVDGTSVVTSGVAAVDLSGKADASHTHTKSQISDFPTIPDVSGKIDTAGTGLSKSSTTLNHSNSVTAQTTQAVYPIKIDAQGHISAYGSAQTIPTITDTYSGTSSNGMSGKAVKSAIDALDGTVSGSAGSGKTLTAFSQTDGKVSATFGSISITKSQVSDFPTIPSTAADVGAVPTTRTVNGKALSTDITLSASDVSALPSSTSIPTKVSDLTNDSGFISSYTETDPVFTASTAYGISSTDVSNWNNGKLSLDTTAASGTTDGKLYAAINTLGWASDVIE